MLHETRSPGSCSSRGLHVWLAVQVASDLIRSMAATAPSPLPSQRPPHLRHGLRSDADRGTACRRCHRERTNRKTRLSPTRAACPCFRDYQRSSPSRTWKPSYEADTRNVAISTDTRLDIQLTRRATVHPLRRVVYEITPAGPSPVEGVHIDAFSCEPIFTACDRGLSLDTATDREGFYSIPGVYAGQNFICAAKEGYRAELTAPSNVPLPMPIPVTAGQPLTVTGHARFDIRLVRR